MANSQGNTAATTQSTTNTNPLAVSLAADVYGARQTRIAHPSGRFVQNRFYLNEAEMSLVPASVPPPSKRFPFSLLNYARTKQHVATIFGVSVDELRAEVKRRNAQRNRTPKTQAAQPAGN